MFFCVLAALLAFIFNPKAALLTLLPWGSLPDM